MNTKIAKSTIVLLLLSVLVNAQTPIVITGTKFTYPVISKWIAEYTKENPQVQILLVSKNTDNKKVDISVVAHQPSIVDVADKQTIPVNKYALLPVAGQSNTYLKKLKGHGLDKKELDKLFFDESIFEDSKEKTKSPVNVYARESHSCSAIAFASFFGRQANELRGKKIAGDDIFLLSSVKNDSIGITFNNLSYLYDINTRKLKDGLAILPLADLSKDQNASLNNIDGVISTLESEKVETIPVQEINFVVSKTVENKEVLKFISWVINNGQQYNHQFGFLNLDKNVQSSESLKLSEILLTASN